jgi:hypothetical protein
MLAVTLWEKYPRHETPSIDAMGTLPLALYKIGGVAKLPRLLACSGCERELRQAGNIGLEAEQSFRQR